jgi:uncharacterized caspase-like protein
MKTSKDNSSLRRKLALIIGCNKYDRPDNRLNHSVNDANALSKLLKEKLKFDDVKTWTDQTYEENKIPLSMSTIADFAETINDDALVLFYFSGHAYQVDGKHYFIPCHDSQIEDDTTVKPFAIWVERTLERLVENNQSYATVFILDCCRPYLLKDTSSSNSKWHR